MNRRIAIYVSRENEKYWSWLKEYSTNTNTSVSSLLTLLIKTLKKNEYLKELKIKSNNHLSREEQNERKL